MIPPFYIFYLSLYNNNNLLSELILMINILHYQTLKQIKDKSNFDKYY